ncbi:hypothetical protein BZA70DRAFT_152449 [Myxozyma melibiosi]|uniref:Uncharacterized protein n=1 Tax=Myxozyma melibiosi TaxID=54550 RepID=A0ABR1F636_9ASCO
MSHLRKAWRRRFEDLDVDDDQVGEDEVVYLDEQQQEELITSLRTENETINYRYKIAFTTITLLQTPIFVLHPALVYMGAPRGHLLTVLTLSSLLATAYTIHTTPVSTSSLSAAIATDALQREALDGLAWHERVLRRENWTNAQLIIALNFMLSAVIALSAVVQFNPLMGIDYLWFCPLGSLLAVLLVRGWMREGDVDSLEQFRYKYKGA